MASPPSPRVDFLLRYQDGRARLGLREPAQLGVVLVPRIDLEVPRLRFPFEMSADPRQFQSRYCTLAELELEVRAEALQVWLTRQPRLARLGLSRPIVRFSPRGASVAVRVQSGESSVATTVHLSFARGQKSARHLAVRVDAVHLFGLSALPAPLVPATLSVAAGGPTWRAPENGEAARAPSELDGFEVDVVEQLLWYALPHSGWRLPRYGRASLAAIEPGADRLILRFAGELGSDGADAPRAPALDPGLAAVDAQLLAGAFDKARELALDLGQRGATPALRRRAEERALAILASQPRWYTEAERLALDIRASDPDHTPARLALAALLAGRGEAARAAEQYELLLDGPFAAPECALDADEAALRAAELYTLVGSERALRLAERVLASNPEESRAYDLLAQRYEAERRYIDLVQLERRRLSRALGPAEEASAYRRLGRVWTLHLAEPQLAEDALRRALELQPEDATSWELYASTLSRLGRLDEAWQAIERAADLSPNRPEVHAHAAHLALSRGRTDQALEHVEQVLAQPQVSTVALEDVGDVLQQLGRTSDAMAALDRALSRIEQPTGRARVLSRLALMAQTALGDRQAAKRYAERALELSETRDTLRLLAQIARDEERPADELRYLTKLVAAGEDDARARRIRLLEQLGRLEDAQRASEELAQSASRSGLELLVEIAKKRGDVDVQRGALERLIVVSPSARPRRELGVLLAAEGDLDGAQRRLNEALHAAATDGDSGEALAERRAILEPLCDVLLRIGDDGALDRVLGELGQLRETPAERARTLAAQGAARARLGLTHEAADAYRTALALDGDDPTIRTGLAEAAVALGLWDEARAALEPLHARGLPPRVERALRLADLAERSGDLAAAIAFAGSAIELGAAGADAIKAYNSLVRLAHARGDFQTEVRTLLQAAEDERLGEPDPARASRLVAAADRLRRRLEQPAEAEELYERALQIDPLQMTALDALEAMLDVESSPERLAQILSRKVAATAKRPAQQKAILARLAELYATRLGRPDAAHEAYERALAIDPHFRPALAHLAAEARQVGQFEAERGYLEKLVGTPSTPSTDDPLDPEQVSRELERLAEVCAWLDDDAAAERYLRRLLETQPANPRGLALLEQLYTQKGRLTELLAVLAVATDLERDVTRADDLRLRRAQVLNELGRRDEAVALVELVLPRRPQLGPRLAELLGDARSTEKLVELGVRQAEQLQQSGKLAEAEQAFVDASHMAHDRLRDFDRADRILLRVLELNPQSRVAISGRLAIARERNDIAEQDRLLARLVDLEPSVEGKAERLAERVRALDSSGQRSAARALLAELDVATAPESLLRLRLDLESAIDGGRDSFDLVEELRRRAATRGDQQGERMWLRRLFSSLLGKGLTPSAEPYLRRLIELDPDNREAAQALVTTVRARHALLPCPEELADALERLLAVEQRALSSPLRIAELATEIARSTAETSPAAASVRLREALALQPGYAPAAALLARLLQRAGQPARALQTLAGIEQPSADLHLLQAELHEQLGQMNEAAESLREAGDAASPERLALALERASRLDEALLVWRTIGTDEVRRERVAPLCLRLAERALAAGSPHEARTYASDAFLANPQESAAIPYLISGLEGADALRLAADLAPALPPVAAARLFVAVADRYPEEIQVAALEQAASLDPEPNVLARLGELRSGEAAARSYRQALERAPHLLSAIEGVVNTSPRPAALRALGDAYTRLGDEPTASDESKLARATLSLYLAELARDENDLGLARERFERALTESNALATGDAATRLRARARRGLVGVELVDHNRTRAEHLLLEQVGEGLANDADRRQLAEIFSQRGDHERVLTVVHGMRGVFDLESRALEALGRFDGLASLLVDESERRPAEEARRLLGQAAEVAERHLADPRLATQLLERAVSLGPASGEIYGRLSQLYFGPIDDPNRGATAAARALAADPQRTELLVMLGDYHHEQRELGPAEDYYRRALERDAVPSGAIGRVYLNLADYAKARGDAAAEEKELYRAAEAGYGQAWSRLVELYRLRDDRLRLAEALRHLVKQVDGLVRLAALRELHSLVAPEEAARIDEEIALLDPRDSAVRERILSRLRSSGNTAALADQLERFLDASPPQARAPFASELGRVAGRAGDTQRAIRAFRSALEISPSLDVALGLLSTLAPLGRSLEAAPLLEAAIRRPGTPPPVRSELGRLYAELQLLPGGDPGRALDLLKDLEAQNVPVQLEPELHRNLLRNAERFGDLLAEIDRTAQSVAEDDRLALTLEAVDLLEHKLHQPMEAARRLGPLTERFPDRRDLLARARNLYAAAGEPLLALQLVEREMRLAGPTDTPILQVTRGELLLAAGADNEAEAALLRVLVTSPRSGRAHAALALVRRRRGDLAGAVEYLIAAAESPDLDPARAASAAVEAADILLAEGDPVTAERLYHLAASLDSSHRAALEGLTRLAEVRGEHERHIDLLGRVSALAIDRKERAQIAMRRARLFAEHLGRELDAYRAYKEAVAGDPTLLEAIRPLRKMAEDRADWAVAIEQYRREIAVVADAALRAQLYMSLGDLYELRLLDVPEALRAYEEAADLLPPTSHETTPWERLVRLYAEEGRLHDAAQAAEQLARAFFRAERVAEGGQVLLRAAELYQRSSDSIAARRVLDQVAALGGDYAERAQEAVVHLLDETEPAQLQRTLIEQLTVEPEGPARLEILRKLLQVSARLGDDAEVDLRAQEILLRAPDDSLAFAERRRLLQKRNDTAGIAALMRARAPHLQDSLARAQAYYEAGRIAEQQQRSVAQAVDDYERAISADPSFVPALDMLADVTYRARQIDRARQLYARLAELGSSLGHDEIALRRAKLAEEAGDLDEARALYTLATRLAPGRADAYWGLAELARLRNDSTAEYNARRTGLDLLPLDDVERLTEERLRVARLALQLGDTQSARNYFELVLMVDPARPAVLEELVRLYEQLGEYNEAANAYERAAQLLDDPKRRAEMLFRRGEILRTRLGQPDLANDAYLKAADLHPGHAPTLRRLIAFYYSEGDYPGLADVFRELDQLGAGPGELAIEAAIGLALNGDEVLATMLLEQVQPQPATLAAVLAAARVRVLEKLDPALATVVKILGGGTRGEKILGDALRERLRHRPTETGAHLTLGRLYDVAGDSVRAQLHYAVLAYIDETSPAALRLADLGPPQALAVAPIDLVHPAARSSVRDALCALAPYITGFPPAPVDTHPEPQWAERLRPIASAFGVNRFEVAVAHDILDPAWPAWLEPSTPPRLLLTRHLLVDEAAARFATARALHALSAGLPLVEGRVPEDVMGLVRAAAIVFGLTADSQGPFVATWLNELAAIGVRPAALPAPARSRLEHALGTCLTDRSAVVAASAYCAAERLTADRVALAATGDFRAAFVTLGPAEAQTAAARARALVEHPPLSELLSWISARLDS